MNDNIERFYHQQLTQLRQAGQSLAKRYPKTASRLKIDAHGIADPMMERIVQSFALLMANIHANNKSDQDFLAQQLLRILFPATCMMLPSMMIMQCHADKELASCLLIKKGQEFTSQQSSINTCTFKTAYETIIWPISLNRVAWHPMLNLPQHISAPKGAKSFVHFSIEANNSSFSLEDFIDKPLRIYLESTKQYTENMIEMIITHQLSAHFVSSQAQDNNLFQVEKPVHTVGFGEDDLLLPIEKSGYEDCQVFSEFSAYPAKHHFIDLGGLYQAMQYLQTASLDIYLFLDSLDPALLQQHGHVNYHLSCVPLINLFSQTTKPKRIYQEQDSFPLEITGSLAKHQYEIYDVLDCTIWQQGGEKVNTKPIYQINHNPCDHEHTVCWFVTSQPCWLHHEGNLPGSETLLHIASHQPFSTRFYQMSKVLCTNRDAVLQENFSQQDNSLQMTAISDQLFHTKIMTHPTPPWRDINIKTMNHVLSIMTCANQGIFNPKTAESYLDDLQDLLKILNRSSQAEVNQIIDHIHAFTVSKEIARYPKYKQLSYVMGLHVTLTVHLDQVQQGLLFLFGCSVNKLLRHYCPMNSSITLEIVNQVTNKRWVWPTQFL